MQLTQTLDHLITQIAFRLAAELKPALLDGPTHPEASPAKEFAALREENQTLSTKLTHLEAELASIKAQLASPANQATEQPSGPTEAQQEKPASKKSPPARQPNRSQARRKPRRWTRHERKDGCGKIPTSGLTSRARSSGQPGVPGGSWAQTRAARLRSMAEASSLPGHTCTR